MKCLVCQGSMILSFRKNFPAYHLLNVEYWECTDCGFVSSKTHAEMNNECWAQLNKEYHSGHQGTDTCSDDPGWFDRIRSQATVIADMTELDLIDIHRPWLDYACGDGKLSNLLKTQFALSLGKYERYMNRTNGYLSDDALKPRRYGFVVSTSVLEHLRSREQMDAITALVADDGVMGVHTLVGEHIPKDPSWFYLLPVHCAFFTNRSMQILFEEWGYTEVPPVFWTGS